MRRVRTALALPAGRGLDLWSDDEPASCPLLVDRAGEIFVRTDDVWSTCASIPLYFQKNLIRPRPHLRIVPSKVSGEPHLEHSRNHHPDPRRLSASRLRRWPLQ
jgi:hypothetical protein